MQLVTLQEARDQLRIDDSADDADLSLKIAAASEAVLDYLGDEPSWLIGAPLAVPARVKQATLVTVGWLYRERDGSKEYEVDPRFGYGYALPKAALSLLYSLRRPTVI